MREIDLDTWEGFEEKFRGLENDSLQNDADGVPLYRGQGNNSWGLRTTLERYRQERLPLREYHGLISAVKPQVESFTGLSWDILLYPEGFDDWLQEYDTSMPQGFGRPAFQSTYSYMLYLRHHGFPSPMLDWTSSPYVAAFFAFRRPTAARVSIFAYVKRTIGVVTMIGRPDYPYIHKLGPYVRTHRRHFLQQGQYTISIVRDAEATWRYAPHKDAFDRNDGQDMLWKFTIPCSERSKVLRTLDVHNLSALSLFESEEALMETMALREIDLRKRKL